MSTAGLVLQTIGAELEAYGHMRAGQIAKRIHDFNARSIAETSANQVQALEIARQMGERNAVIAEQEAQFAVQVSAFNERRFRQQASYRQAQARANVGASGVTFEGSPLETLATSAREIELDALTTRFQGELAARAQREEARLQRYNASLRVVEQSQVRRASERQIALERYAGKEAVLAGYLKGAAAGLRGSSGFGGGS